MEYRSGRMLLALAVVAALGWNASEPALAQESRSVVIANGKVSINGKQLSDDAVPESLREFDGHVNFSFTGDEQPLIGFGSTTYRIEDDRIVEIGPMPMAFSFPGRAGGKVLAFPGDHPARAFAFRVGTDSLQLDQSFEELKRSLDELSISIPKIEIDAQEMERGMEELRLSLGSLKDLSVPSDFHLRKMPAHVFRPMDIEVYLDEIREMDHELYEQLLNERDMEDESLDLARRLHEADSPSERETLARELREHLEEVFEIRQENRREEIRKLEKKMENLRRRLENREAMRERIIQNRLDFLLEEGED